MSRSLGRAWISFGVCLVRPWYLSSFLLFEFPELRPFGTWLHLSWSVLILFRKHDAPVKTIHWIKAPNYSCVMTGSWDKTLKVWLWHWGDRTAWPGWTLTSHAVCTKALNGQLLAFCCFFFLLVLGYTIIKSHDGFATPWKMLLRRCGEEFPT